MRSALARGSLGVSLAISLCACGAYRAVPKKGAGDGRLPLGELQARYSPLTASGLWTRETVFAYPDDPALEISAWRTRKTGPALWLIAGIHGEEPAGPNAVAARLKSVLALAESGVPIVFLPLCYPKAYSRNWRYPNTAGGDWRLGGYSVGDAEYLLPDLEDSDKPRAPKPAGPETAALTRFALKTSELYPPQLVIDLHEDELSAEGGYIYSQGQRALDNDVGRRIIALLKSSDIPIRLSGKTRFGETIDQGVISRDDKGRPIRDGSLDELLAAPTVFDEAKRRAGPAAPVVIVVETPAFAGADLEKRVKAHSAVVEHLEELWNRATLTDRPRR